MNAIHSILTVASLVDMIAYHLGLSPALLTIVNSTTHEGTSVAPWPVGALMQLLVRRSYLVIIAKRAYDLNA